MSRGVSQGGVSQGVSRGVSRGGLQSFYQGLEPSTERRNINIFGHFVYLLLLPGSFRAAIRGQQCTPWAVC